VKQTALALSVLLCACATSTPAQPPTAAPSAAAAPASAPTLALVSTLEPLAVTCLSAEPARANALDDNCDGVIDALPRTGALSVAFAHGAEGEATVSLVDGGQKAVAPSSSDEPVACAPAEGAVTGNAHFQALPAGARELVLRHVRACGEPKPLPVVLSVQTGGAVHSYLVTLAPGQTLSLGTVGAP
jgi:hypothetical protein